MEIKFERIEGKSLPFYMVLFAFAALAGAGLVATLYASLHGLAVTGMNIRVPWGLQIVMAVYYIGFGKKRPSKPPLVRSEDAGV